MRKKPNAKTVGGEGVPGPADSLNAVCPYFTMFPLKFPIKILKRERRKNAVIVDPFCGRGTTLYAARKRGFTSFGMDSNPTAAAIAAAKLSNTSPEAIIRAFDHIILRTKATSIPDGVFWQWAFDSNTLTTICKLRSALMRDCRSAARRALRGILLGVLHGPLRKGEPTYLSNQMPRTFASKPDYSVRYWKREGMLPPKVDIRAVVVRKAFWFFGQPLKKGRGRVVTGDSRRSQAVLRLLKRRKAHWIITSPPYFGMRTYRTDQWLRLWFLGGGAEPDYGATGQLSHKSPEDFANDLQKVWKSLEGVAHPDCSMVIRFGSINDRKADPLYIIRKSLSGTRWRVRTICKAGSAADGRRQADAFQSDSSDAMPEYDVWTRLLPKSKTQ